jgi:peptide/nickel transport system substrate-binding protein
MTAPQSSGGRWLPCLLATASFIAASFLSSPGASAAASHRGGTLRLTAQSAAGTIDPQINYTLEFFQVMEISYDGLLTFEKAKGTAGLTIVPDLATSLPKPEDGGKTYVFTLRRGIRFSDGRPVTVDDVVASFRRLYKVGSPTAGTFFSGIVGADACNKTPATCTLPGVVGDRKAGTITIHLTAPDAEFYDKIAFIHAVVLPADAPAKDAGVTPIPGTGPYMIASYDPNHALRMVRNPYFHVWSNAAQPDGYPDKILYSFGADATSQVTMIENGQDDWMFDQPPPDRQVEMEQKYPSQLHLSPETGMYYASMNVNLPPFNDIRVRRAINYAVDRRAAVIAFGGRALATPTCQVLPPGIPGYKPYCPYTKNPGTHWTAPDLGRALALIKASGTEGQHVTLITDDSSIGRNIGAYLQSLLTSLGYKTDFKPISANIEYTYLQNSKNKVQIGLSYWLQDYPAPSDFLNVLYSCASYHPGSDSSINMSEFCDPKIDSEMQTAMSTSITDPATADTMWSSIDRQVTDQAPAAMLFVPKQLNFVSARVGNYTFNPQGFLIFSQLWVQ